MTPDEYREHAARAMHEDVTPVGEVIRQPDEVVHVKERGNGNVEMTTFNWELSFSSNRKSFLLSTIENPHGLLMDRKQLSELIALLQKAKEIMKGESA